MASRTAQCGSKFEILISEMCLRCVDVNFYGGNGAGCALEARIISRPANHESKVFPVQIAGEVPESSGANSR